ncbi:hypothetical protein H8959_021528 [Pygathrix nigripes]
MWTESSQGFFRGTPGQLVQHRLSKGPPGPPEHRPQGKASAGPPTLSRFLGPRTPPLPGLRRPAGRPHGTQGLPGQRVGPWSRRHRIPDSHDYVTSLQLVKTLMMICDLGLAADGLAMRELQWWRDQEAALSETNITDALHEPSQSQQEAHHTGCPGLRTACARTAASPAHPPTTPRLPLSKIRAYQVSSRKIN